MTNGQAPKGGWAHLVPELLVTDVQKSLAFWRDILGFEIAYHRLDSGFVYLERPEGSQIMLNQRNGNWETGELAQPFGRGAMFQIYVNDLQPVVDAVTSAGIKPYSAFREVWRKTGDCQKGQVEIFLQDPDGYLIMMAQDIGQKPLEG